MISTTIKNEFKKEFEHEFQTPTTKKYHLLKCLIICFLMSILEESTIYFKLVSLSL